MRSRTEPDTAVGASSALSTSLRDVLNLEAICAFPPDHHILAVCSRTQCGPTPNIVLEHEEFDASGSLMTSYTSFEQMTAAGERQSGWRRSDCDDRVVREGDSLS